MFTVQLTEWLVWVTSGLQGNYPSIQKKMTRGDTCLRPEVRCGANVFVLGFGRAPWVVQLETLVTIAGLAVHAALGGLLLRRLADVAHDRHCGAGSLAVALNNAFQGEVTEQHADAALAEVDVMVAAGAGDGGDPGSHRPSAPPRGRDRAWRRE